MWEENIFHLCLCRGITKKKCFPGINIKTLFFTQSWKKTNIWLLEEFLESHKTIYIILKLTFFRWDKNQEETKKKKNKETLPTKKLQ